MRATTVRFGDDLWTLLEREAERQGVSAAQFVRDATILRVAYLAAERGDPQARATVERVAAGTLDEAPERDVMQAVMDRVREPRRLTALRGSGLLDAPPDAALDRLSALAARVLDAPVALVSLVDEDRQFFASCVGLAEPWSSRRETPLSHSFCQHAVAARSTLVVGDAREHPILHTNPAIRDLGVVAYAGAPLIARDGNVLGTLCVIDHRPRTWTREQVEILEDLAQSVLSEIELRGRRPTTNGTSGA